MRSIVLPIELVISWLTMFAVGTELYIFSPLLPYLAADYHISTATAGLSVTIFSLSYTINAPIFGYLSDRFGQKRVLTCALLSFGAANLMTATAANWICLLAARFLAGAASAGISPTIYALVASAAPPDRRATWLAVAVSGLLVSFAIGAPGGVLFSAFFDWVPLFVALASLGLLLAWLNYRVWQNNVCTSSILSASLDFRDSRTLIWRLIPMIGWSIAFYSVYTYLGVSLTATGFSPGQIARAILCCGCGAVVGVFTGGRMADLLGANFTARASLAGFSVCLLLLRLAFDYSRLVEFALFLSCAVAQWFFPAQQAGLVYDFPKQRSTVLAWNNSALFLGISIGSLAGAENMAIANFDVNLTISSGIAFISSIISRIVFPDRDHLPDHEIDRTM